jgi:hypothetical protein
LEAFKEAMESYFGAIRNINRICKFVNKRIGIEIGCDE